MNEEKAKRAKRKNFPIDTLEEVLSISQKIADEMGGKPLKRLLLADALGIRPSSSNFRDLLSSSYKYGLTEGTEKATQISLTAVGKDATQNKDSLKRKNALRKAAMTPPIFERFFQNYADKRLPSDDMFSKILISEYEVPEEHAQACSNMIKENGRFAGIIRDIGGAPHVLSAAPEAEESAVIEEAKEDEMPAEAETAEFKPPEELEKEKPTKPIFIGHGKKKKPLQKIQKILSNFQIPHKVTTEEAHLGRPISQKVKDTMTKCGSAILIFTCDENFYDDEGNEIWRPSENVVYELGAASFAYGDRIVIFKEKGLHFPTNYQNIGYIEFEEDTLDAKIADLLKELIGFGLVKITPT
jgi:predicted nucleotide-binding protein